MQLKRTYLLFTLAISLGVFNAFAGAQEEGVYSPKISCIGPPFGLRLPATLPQLLQLGKVLRQQVGEIKDWGEYKTTAKLIQFSGLELVIITFSNDASRYMLMDAEITDSKWRIAGPFTVGATVASTRKALGKLADRDPGLRFSYGGDAATISFKQSKGKITKIIYECYVE
jgi:hypothetical protein